MMRVAVGGVYHESNTFFSQPMTMARFAEGHLHFGRDVLDHWAGTSSEIAGFMSGRRRLRVRAGADDDGVGHAVGQP